MKRIITYRITPDDDTRIASRYLRSIGYSRRNLSRLKEYPDTILLNGIPIHLNERLHDGDILTIIINEEESSPLVPVHLPFEIVFEDEDLLVVNKPAGMPLHPSFQNTDNTLANALTWYFEQKGEPFIFRCSNRLDRDTSGLTIVAKHKVAAGMLSEMGVRREITREYLAIVRGQVIPPEGTIDAPIGREEGSIIARRIDFLHGERAVTHFHVVKEKNGLSLVSLKLETGRTHQIRVHMKYLGYPLLGDHLYNPEDRTLITRQALHAYRLTFLHPIKKEALTFESELPEDMARLL